MLRLLCRLLRLLLLRELLPLLVVLARVRVRVRVRGQGRGWGGGCIAHTLLTMPHLILVGRTLILP